MVVVVTKPRLPCGSPLRGRSRTLPSSSSKNVSTSTKSGRLERRLKAVESERDGEAHSTRRDTLFQGTGALLLAAGAGSSDLLLHCRSSLAADTNAKKSLYNFTAKMYGEDAPLKTFEGKVTVVVNVASE